MYGCRLARFSPKDEEVEGRVATGTRDSFSIVARRPKVSSDANNELNSFWSSWEAVACEMMDRQEGRSHHTCDTRLHLVCIPCSRGAFDKMREQVQAMSMLMLVLALMLFGRQLLPRHFPLDARSSGGAVKAALTYPTPARGQGAIQCFTRCIRLLSVCSTAMWPSAQVKLD